MYVIYSSKWDANRAVGQERLLSDLWLELTADDTSPVHWLPLYSSLQLLVNLQAVIRDVDRGLLRDYHIKDVGVEILDRLDRETWLQKCYPNDYASLKERVRELRDHVSDATIRRQFLSALTAFLGKVRQDDIVRKQIDYVCDLVESPKTSFQSIVCAGGELLNDLGHKGHGRAHFHRWLLRTVVNDRSNDNYLSLLRRASHLTTREPNFYRVIFHVALGPDIPDTEFIAFLEALPGDFGIDPKSSLEKRSKGRFAQVTVEAYDHHAAVERGKRILRRYLCSNRLAQQKFDRTVSTYCAVKEDKTGYVMPLDGQRSLTERRLYNDGAFYALPRGARNEQTFAELDQIIYWLEQSWQTDEMGSLIAQWTALEFLCSMAGKSAAEAVQLLAPAYVVPQYPRLLLIDFWKFMLHAGIDFPELMKTQLGMDAASSRATDKKCDLLELLRLAAVTDDKANQIRPLVTEFPILEYKWRRVVRLSPTLRLRSSRSPEVWTDITAYERSIDFDLKTCYRVRNTIVHDAAIDVLQLDRVCQRLNWLLCAMLDTILHQFVRNPSLALSELHDVNLRWFTDWKDQLKDDANPVTLDEVLFPRVHFLR